MQRLFSSCFMLVAIAFQANAQNAGIGTTTPDASAILHLSSTEKGLLIPRMDSTQRNAIISPAQGLLIYQVRDNPGFYYYANGKWNKVGNGGNEWLMNANNDIYTTRKVGVGTAAPNASAALDISSTDKGLLIPRMTEAQKNLITTPGGGLLIYQTDVNTGFYYYDAIYTAWKKIGGDGDEWMKNAANNIYSNKNVGIGNSIPTEKLDILGNIKASGNITIIGEIKADGNITTNTELKATGNITTSGALNATGNITTNGALNAGGNIVTNGEIRPNGSAGLANQVLTSTGAGTMTWASMNNTSSSVNGGWGDCSIYNIDSYYPIAKQNGNFGDRMGAAVAISGNFAIAGAPFANENGLPVVGSATIYKLNSNTGAWESQVKLTNPNAANNDRFGFSVGISGDYAIVGAPFDDEVVDFTINGSVTIFKRNATTGAWDSQGKLLNPNSASNDNFGYSVSISGDYAIVGAYTDDENGFTDNGSATIFKRNAITNIWQSQGKLTNPNAANSDYFEYSVSIFGDYAVVGAPSDDESGFNSVGTITIFKRNAATGIWETTGKITTPFPADGIDFGSSVAIYGDWVVAGAPDGISANGLTSDGYVQLYKRNATTGVWNADFKLANSQPSNFDYFGTSVSIGDNYMMVGAFGDDENGTADAGTVTIFKKVGNAWIRHQKFAMPNAEANSFFGTKVAIDANSGAFIVGAPNVAASMGLIFMGRAK